MKRKTLETAVIAAALAASLLTGCSKPAEETTAAAEKQESKADAGQEKKESPEKLEELTVGASPAPHAEILEAAREVLASKGYDLKIVEYTDYVLPNNALDSGDLDANYFQHQPYLDSFNAQNGTELSGVAVIHYEPFGIYAGKSASLDAGLEATKNDIVENPKNLDIVEIEAAQLPRSLQDGDVAVINGNYAIEAGLKVSDALATEDAESLAAQTYGNVIAVRAGEEESPKTKALIEALTSDEVKSFMESTYEGAVVPVF